MLRQLEYLLRFAVHPKGLNFNKVIFAEYWRGFLKGHNFCSKEETQALHLTKLFSAPQLLNFDYEDFILPQSPLYQAVKEGRILNLDNLSIKDIELRPAVVIPFLGERESGWLVLLEGNGYSGDELSEFCIALQEILTAIAKQSKFDNLQQRIQQLELDCAKLSSKNINSMYIISNFLRTQDVHLFLSNFYKYFRAKAYIYNSKEDKIETANGTKVPDENLRQLLQTIKDNTPVQIQRYLVLPTTQEGNCVIVERQEEFSQIEVELMSLCSQIFCKNIERKNFSVFMGDILRCYAEFVRLGLLDIQLYLDKFNPSLPWLSEVKSLAGILLRSCQFCDTKSQLLYLPSLINTLLLYLKPYRVPWGELVIKVKIDKDIKVVEGNYYVLLAFLFLLILQRTVGMKNSKYVNFTLCNIEANCVELTFSDSNPDSIIAYFNKRHPLNSRGELLCKLKELLGNFCEVIIDKDLRLRWEVPS